MQDGLVYLVVFSFLEMTFLFATVICTTHPSVEMLPVTR